MNLTTLVLILLASSPDAGTAPPKSAFDLVKDTGAVKPIRKKKMMETQVPELFPRVEGDAPTDPRAFEGLRMKGPAPVTYELPGPSKGKGGFGEAKPEGEKKAEPKAPPKAEAAEGATHRPAPRSIDLD